jgi:hypothetical protein
MVDAHGNRPKRATQPDRFLLEHCRPVRIVRDQIAGGHVRTVSVPKLNNPSKVGAIVKLTQKKMCEVRP